MKIDITGIAGKHGASIKVSCDINPMDLEHEILGVELLDTIKLDCVLTNYTGDILVTGEVKGRYKASCHRCLQEINGEYKLDINERFVMQSDDMDYESYVYEGHHVDLTSLLIDNILLSFPTVVLCKEDCKGLCPICGQNLNQDICTCDKQGINIKMEKLKDYFNK
ncbi:MAG: DUF177 domain-containing protein [Clostridia bacterium]|nr:DUF177 domain-containing protein [Clostridia bacterium]